MSQTLGQGSYTRNGGAPSTRDSTLVRFHYGEEIDPVATAAAGRPIYVQRERIQYIQPGNPNQPVMPVGDEERERFPKEYAAFLKGHEMAADGTPIEHWSYLGRGHVLELKALGIQSVEQCAALSDLAIQKIGMGGRAIRDMAKAYLDEADQMAITSAALARAEKAEARVANLETQAAETRELLNKMHTEMMAMKNAPSAVDAYIPGQHDPMQQGQAPQGYVAASSLDSLAVPRPRGRPPGSPNRPKED